jgi:hypothetical protein
VFSPHHARVLFLPYGAVALLLALLTITTEGRHR